MENTDTMFIKIDDQVSLRRNFLETSKEVVTSLQRYEAFRHAREMKIKEIFALKNIMMEINKLCSDLDEALPAHHLGPKPKTPERELKKRIRQTKTSRRKQFTKIKPISELDKLEEELNDIESKLESLHE